MDNDKIVLRPSSIRSFCETPSKWYLNHVLGVDKFEGNTATYFGTVVHAFAESYYTLEPFNPHAILENAPEEVDRTHILANYEEVCRELEDKYLSQHSKPELLEHFMKKDLDNDFLVQGTCDVYDKGVLVDYKTAGKVNKSINDNIQQLHIYAYLLALTGREVHTYRIVQIVHKTKTLKPRINVLECKANPEEGERLVDLMHMKAKLAYDNPDYVDVIFHQNPYSFLNDTPKVECEFTELSAIKV
jgi:hypothetical protein